jgi:hypothetical protein
MFIARGGVGSTVKIFVVMDIRRFLVLRTLYVCVVNWFYFYGEFASYAYVEVYVRYVGCNLKNTY